MVTRFSVKPRVVGIQYPISVVPLFCPQAGYHRFDAWPLAGVPREVRKVVASMVLTGEWIPSSDLFSFVCQGLTGLANTLPNAKFRGLRQVLHADGMVFDAEYEVMKESPTQARHCVGEGRRERSRK